MPPDFLGIGAHRSGSSWLYVHLRAHPQVWLPPIKELHYFDVQRTAPFLNRILLKHITIRIREHGRGLLRGQLCWIDAAWEWQYIFGRRTDAWYMSLFKPGRDKVTGEITPAYSTLDTGNVAAIYRILSKPRIIFLMRDPIERAWSHALRSMSHKVGRPLHRRSEADFRRHFDSPESRLRGDYVRILDTWGTLFSTDRFFVGFTDEIRATPKNLLLRLYRFLDINFSPSLISDDVFRRVNASRQLPLPNTLRTYLAEQYHDQLKELHHRFGGYATKWLHSAEEVLLRTKIRPSNAPKV